MTDKELLELAAKAAGWTGWRSKHGYWNLESPEGKKSSHCHDWLPYDAYTGEKLSDPTFADAINSEGWNPITDDGDALRLAVKLRLTIKHDEDNAVLAGISQDQSGAPTLDRKGPWFWKEWTFGTSQYAATRRAIVHAAAEIGKAMK